MKKSISILFLILIIQSGCIKDSAEKNFLPTKYSDDIKKDTLKQSFTSPKTKEFIGIFLKARGLGFYKVIKLYSSDSISIAELDFGEHPLEVVTWKDSVITLKACVYSAHGDSTYRKWYLDNSVDKNIRIGRYLLIYQKNYDCFQYPYF